MKRIRKPRPLVYKLYGGQDYFAAYMDNESEPTITTIGGQCLRDAKDCRRLAKWLERAAEYLESREGN